MITLFIIILGLAVGSFLNVCIDRLSFEQSLHGRSHCDHCKKKLAWQELIPVFSWLYLGGKSRCCGKQISAYYPIVELATGSVFVFLLSQMSVMVDMTGLLHNFLSNIPIKDDGILFLLGLIVMPMVYVIYFGIVSALIVIFFADLKYHIIPDEATIAIVIFSVLLALFRGVLIDNIVAGIILFFILYSLFFITKGRGMGFGDVKYVGAMGLLLGLKAGLVGLYLSFVGGGIVSVFLILLKVRGLKSKIAFGPFLIFGTVVMLFFQDSVFIFLRRYFPYI